MTDADRWERELRHSWPLLGPRRSTEVTTIPLPTTTTEPLRIGVDGNGARHLLVPLLEEQLRGDDGESALALRVRTYTFAGVPARYLDVVCGRPDLFDLFDEVLVDVLIDVGEDPSAAAARTVEVIGRWRALLSTRRARLLTLAAQMSLFAELTVLDVAGRDGDVSAQWWRGPKGEPHDILLPTHALEVKAVGPGSTSIEIHGLGQLDQPGRPLALVMATVSEADDGRTLPELVDDLLTRCDDRGEAIRLLAQAGYSRADAERYTERFSISDLVMIEVDASVPRIVTASFGANGVPEGVDGVVYRIDLAALAPHYRKGEGAIRAWLEGTT